MIIPIINCYWNYNSIGGVDAVNDKTHTATEGYRI